MLRLGGRLAVVHRLPRMRRTHSIVADALAPVLPNTYRGPFAFTGTIHSVTVDVSGDLIEDDESTMRRLMAQQ